MPSRWLTSAKMIIDEPRAPRAERTTLRDEMCRCEPWWAATWARAHMRAMSVMPWVIIIERAMPFYEPRCYAVTRHYWHDERAHTRARYAATYDVCWCTTLPRYHILFVLPHICRLPLSSHCLPRSTTHHHHTTLTRCWRSRDTRLFCICRAASMFYRHYMSVITSHDIITSFCFTSFVIILFVCLLMFYLRANITPMSRAASFTRRHDRCRAMPWRLPMAQREPEPRVRLLSSHEPHWKHDIERAADERCRDYSRDEESFVDIMRVLPPPFVISPLLFCREMPLRYYDEKTRIRNTTSSDMPKHAIITVITLLSLVILRHIIYATFIILP